MPNVSIHVVDRFEHTEIDPHPRIAARRTTVRLRRLNGFDLKIRSALDQLSNVMQSKEIFFIGGTAIIKNIAIMMNCLDDIDLLEQRGILIRKKIADFLVEQQFHLDILSAKMQFDSKMLSILREMTDNSLSTKLFQPR